MMYIQNYTIGMPYYYGTTFQQYVRWVLSRQRYGKSRKYRK